MLITIASDFTDTPGGRHVKDGKYSGEEFRKDILEPAFESTLSGDYITIDFDGTYGYATSFLDEAFGGLARKYGAKKVLEKLKFISNEEPDLPDRVSKYMRESYE